MYAFDFRQGQDHLDRRIDRLLKQDAADMMRRANAGIALGGFVGIGLNPGRGLRKYYGTLMPCSIYNSTHEPAH
jgi:hypothetical protein